MSAGSASVTLPASTEALLPESVRDAAAKLGDSERAGFRAADVHKTAALWRMVSEIPLPKRAYFTADDAAVIQFETTDLENNARPVREQAVLLGDKPRLLPAAPTAIADKGVPPVFVSPSGQRALRFVAAGDDAWIAEVRNCTTGAIEARISSGTTFGRPLLDDQLQGVTWSEDESSLVFVAEKMRLKAPDAWKPVAADDKTVDRSRIASEHRAVWGETYPEHSVTTLVHVTLPTEQSGAGAKATDLLTSDFSAKHSAASPVVNRAGSALVFVAFDHEPRRLGIAYCSSRSTRLFSLALPPRSDDSSDSVAPAPIERTFCRNIRCLKRRPGSDDIAAVVAAEDSLAHFTCSKLVTIHTDSFEVKTLVDVVQTPEGSDAFPGLYVGGSGDLRWVSKETLIVSSQRRSEQVLYAVDVSAGTMRQVPGVGVGTLRVLDTRGKSALVAFSMVTQLPKVLYTADVTAASPSWQEVHDAASATSPALRSVVSNLKTTHIDFTGAEGMHGTRALLHCRADERVDQSRAIVFVHGGPHACDTGAFSRDFLMKLLCGYRLFSVNYGGSSGFGQASIDALGGKCGTDDVNDCVGAVRGAQEQGLLPTDRKRLIITGGSHGGFLTGHLTGQQPTMFCAAAMRNPVTNIASMMYETDIPDWCAFEAGAHKHDAARMFEVSPMAHVEAVETPTLLVLGKGDLRVPPAQGMAWFNNVRSNGRGAEVRLLEYAGVGHDSAASVAAEADTAIYSHLFFSKYCEPLVQSAA